MPRWRQIVFTGAQWHDEVCNSHELKHKFLNMKKFSALSVMEEDVQEGCGFSLSGDIPNPPGCIPVSPALVTVPRQRVWPG
ncbi:hypothetical protein DUI87_14522 [Hirundo rustica rustica]|uniref:Uncharacterized protein n=1 Tax=Hirundo rustica rustica TaxID=333673 RepID=A0A3M0K6V1_HIRRU|nr:hypothetical protein DUI87_14522 [Hirundo rustica rustica]